MGNLITVHFKLSEKGQKDAILQGKEPQRDQTLIFSVEPTEEILSFCEITEKGELHLRALQFFNIYPSSFSEILEKCREDKKEKEKYQKMKEEEEEEKRKKEKEKREWIAQYGSEHLKLAVAEGYSAEEKYITERAQHELGNEVKVDYRKEKCVREREYPSLEALAVERELKNAGFQACTVWGYYCECEKECDCVYHEIVLVKDYLGEYTVIVWED